MHKNNKHKCALRMIVESTRNEHTPAAIEAPIDRGAGNTSNTQFCIAGAAASAVVKEIHPAGFLQTFRAQRSSENLNNFRFHAPQIQLPYVRVRVTSFVTSFLRRPPVFSSASGGGARRGFAGMLRRTLGGPGELRGVCVFVCAMFYFLSSYDYKIKKSGNWFRFRNTKGARRATGLMKITLKPDFQNSRAPRSHSCTQCTTVAAKQQSYVKLLPLMKAKWLLYLLLVVVCVQHSA